jgi:TetR/AcrR family transcriptional repressor of nem operon
MPRKPQFCREEVLDKTLTLFWRNGYKNTSIRDISAETNVQLASLYNAFGDKNAIFKQALDRYATIHVPKMFTLSLESQTPLEDVITLLETIGKCASESNEGCLYINTVNELAEHNPELAHLALSKLQELEIRVEKMLELAMEMGQLSSYANTNDLAKYIMGTLMAIRQAYRMQWTQEDVDAYLSLAIQPISALRIEKPQITQTTQNAG